MTRQTIGIHSATQYLTRMKPLIGIQLDLKGMNFKPSYIPQYMADLAGQKINAILVEYEDVFPFQGYQFTKETSRIWSPATLRMFLRQAKRHGIEIIPLQQCLGHLEYVLAWQKYRRFAENQNYRSTIRVDSPGAVRLVTDLLQQIIAAHPDSRYIHLGMDEAHALHDAAKRLKRPVLDLFLDHLRVLTPVCEAAGKIPMVWSDMLEDHFRPDAFKEFRNRAVFATWDYGAIRGLSPHCRFVGGIRVSREWLDEPENPAAPNIGPGTKFTEDHPPGIKKVLAPYRHGRLYQPLFQLDIWTKLGMRAVSASAARISANLSVLPPYNALASNIRGNTAAVMRNRQLGHIATSWARGTTWGPPNYCIDLQWPLVTILAKSMGQKPEPFWPGIPEKTIDRLIRTLGRCREGWGLELQVADEMDKLKPRAHRHEWEGIALMARVMALQRRADFNLLEVDFFNANHRPCAEEWQRRYRESCQTLRDIAALRRRVRAHFEPRYGGPDFEEWLDHLFGLHDQRIRANLKVCQRKMKLSRRHYSSNLSS